MAVRLDTPDVRLILLLFFILRPLLLVAFWLAVADGSGAGLPLCPLAPSFVELPLEPSTVVLPVDPDPIAGR